MSDAFKEEIGWTKKKKFTYDLAADFLHKGATVFKSSAIVLEEKHIPKAICSRRELVKVRRKEREKTKGAGWYCLSAPESTPQIKNHLEVLQMRSAMDPKRFYKKNDSKVLPKYFQIGKYQDSPLDYYNNRLHNSTLVEELIKNVAFNKRIKSRYKEILLKTKKTNYKKFKRGKKNSRNSAFS